jgi:hypothetical protein
VWLTQQFNLKLSIRFEFFPWYPPNSTGKKTKQNVRFALYTRDEESFLQIMPFEWGK